VRDFCGFTAWIGSDPAEAVALAALAQDFHQQYPCPEESDNQGQE
jgi:hypothetical protein